MFYQNWKLASFVHDTFERICKKSETVGKATIRKVNLQGKLVSFLADILRGSRMIKFSKRRSRKRKCKM